MLNLEKPEFKARAATEWWVYMVNTQCGQLYTGIATDVERRFSEHLATFERQPKAKAKKGAKYFRGHQPVAIVYRQQCENRSQASIIESRLKRLSAAEKQLLVQEHKEK